MSCALKLLILAGAFLVLILAHPLPAKSGELQNSSTEIDTLGSETRVKRQGGCGCGCGCCCCRPRCCCCCRRCCTCCRTCCCTRCCTCCRPCCCRPCCGCGCGCCGCGGGGRKRRAALQVLKNKLAAKLAAEAGNSQESAENLESSAENLPEPVFELVTETSRI